MLMNGNVLLDLNPEDIVIARRFHHARTRAREVVTALLITDDPEVVLTAVCRLYAIPPSWEPVFHALITSTQRAPDAGEAE